MLTITIVFNCSLDVYFRHHNISQLIIFLFKICFSSWVLNDTNSIQFSSLKPVFHFHSLSFHITGRDIRSSHPFSHAPSVFDFMSSLFFSWIITIISFLSWRTFPNVSSTLCSQKSLSMQMLPFTFPPFKTLHWFQISSEATFPSLSQYLTPFKFICDTYHSSYIALSSSGLIEIP